VGDSVHDYVGQMVVGQSIENFASVAFATHDARSLQDTKVLADERLGDAEGADKFVDAPLRLVELEHDRDADRCGERSQDLTGRSQSFLGRNHGWGDGFERVMCVIERVVIMVVVEIAGIRNAHSEAPSRGVSQRSCVAIRPHYCKSHSF
jgi:hypothetical protein